MLPHPPSDHLHHFERRLHLCQVVLWLHEKFEHQPGGDVVNSGTSKASVLLSRAVLGKMVKRAFPDVVTVRRGARGSTKEHYVGLARRQRPIVKAEPEPEPDHVEDDDQQQNTTSTSTSTSTTTSTSTSTSFSTSIIPSSPIQTQALKLPLTSGAVPYASREFGSGHAAVLL
ncbi:uncharacterized protein ACA1_128050 [Acanthamoeba castellanii str. Neff]|uniref:RFX-type winged-helix domain-containing protein n=1 Tax=Acanthamoeba castellanii (strain ATCC 30010 / Neff) TaxID=1257118 RepID=L8GVA4_ACACF|nr:uncharacterized protein ACA1_128050 [Acanthamoeba castellanii str. Neff]ELR16950.1 hypothetical protein ACA1_128050 [Acanthamoeba castellanii str. Neff]